MGSQRTPGPIGLEPIRMCLIDEGTLNRSTTPTPGPSRGIDPVDRMAIEDRFQEVLTRTVPLLPEGIRGEFAAMITPASLAIMAGVLAVWAGSHYFGVGFVVDAILLIAGGIFLGVQVWSAASDLVGAIELTASATSEADLDQAARLLARFIAVVGVAVFAALVLRGAKKGMPRARAAAASAAKHLGGMTASHSRVFQRVAQETGRIIAVRNTNPLSTRWIERGFPPKPMQIKIKTSKKTGVVTAQGDEIAEARKAGYFVVDADGVPRNANGTRMDFNTPPDWPLEPGQVIHPMQKKPLVGDYDLLGVIDPQAPGRNLVVAASEGQILDDWSSPAVRDVANRVNAMLDQPRVMHGAHDGYRGARPDFSDAGGSTVFLPDGSIRNLDTAEDVADFYKELGRQPITGRY
ncbi:anthrax toxin-like adenylyl cyclase domain-containing protein [Tautonia plasticadhaerens]|uniref:Anthrax toxin LF subunit n=1 Tax=Tautonia plasticadhaerens TaxID=2527974 RepID=A0A518GVY4_9BACT|nr:anthrax toxin-like adenylyl cyclase domain-containing protein [Tautonia plasticadhaerens]QDV32711.1 Anthrax toxin LF subunit [Tautonia plasticadhaerens]